MDNSTFSVLMSLYSGDQPEHFISAVDSNFEQTVPPYEIVIVIDGPVGKTIDDAINIVKSRYGEKIRIVRLNKNVGLGAALQEGMKVVRTEIVARADSDDLSDSRRFEYQLREFKQDSQLVLVGGLVKEFVKDKDNIISARRLPEDDDDIRTFAKYRSPFNHPTVMFKKSAIEEVGGYLPFRFLEDYHLWARVLSKDWHVKNVNDATVFMRVDTGMYGRRGGISYGIQNLKLRWFFFKLGMISFGQMLFIDFVVFSMSVIPMGVRKLLYTKFLRQEEN